MPAVQTLNRFELKGVHLPTMPYALPPLALFFFLLIQTAASGQPSLNDLPGLGLTGGVTAWMFWLYRKDTMELKERNRQDVIDARNRIEELAKDFRSIIEDNTRSNNTLVELLRQGGRQQGGIRERDREHPR